MFESEPPKEKVVEIDKSGLSKNLICIEYPGVVNNVDAMLDTLGGVREISRVCSGRNRRLELRFRPNDVYCKPACGDRYKTNGILLSVKVLRKKNSTSNDENKVKSIGVVGRIQTAFKFKSACDFQYLPMEVNSQGQMEDVQETLVPPSFEENSLMQWLEKPSEYFLPPAAFSRVDSTLNTYMYRKENTDERNTTPGPLIGRTRKRRSGHAIFVSFSVAHIPHRPREKAIKFLKVKFLNGDPLMKMRNCFEERPVWSKLALMCVTKFQHDQLKYLLPAVAYYFVTGPFRVMWVRFGYDPRKDPAARIYQTLDYRIRAPAGLISLVKAKRSYANYLLPSKSSHPGAKSVVITKDVFSKKSQEGSSSGIRPDAYIFRSSKIPAARQMFYQYCDIKVPEIEAMLARLPKLPPWTKCDARQGWLPPGFDSQCRDIINGHVVALLKKDSSAADTPSTSMNEDPLLKDEEDADDSSDEGTKWEEEFEDADVDEESETGGQE